MGNRWFDGGKPVVRRGKPEIQPLRDQDRSPARGDQDRRSGPNLGENPENTQAREPGTVGVGTCGVPTAPGRRHPVHRTTRTSPIATGHASMAAVRYSSRTITPLT